MSIKLIVFIGLEYLLIRLLVLTIVLYAKHVDADDQPKEYCSIEYLAILLFSVYLTPS